MNATILAMTPGAESLLWTASRTCKSMETPANLHMDSFTMDESNKVRLIRNLWRAKHLSVFEHVSVTFAIEGISRACLAQLSRHRHLSMSVQSQRYVRPQLSDSGVLPGVLPVSMGSNPVAKKLFLSTWIDVDSACRQLEKMGVPQEDIRLLYPEGTVTNLVLTCNLRTLGELVEKRAENVTAQWEIRDLVKRMANEVDKRLPWFGECIEEAGA